MNTDLAFLKEIKDSYHSFDVPPNIRLYVLLAEIAMATVTKIVLIDLIWRCFPGHFNDGVFHFDLD